MGCLSCRCNSGTVKLVRRLVFKQKWVYDKNIMQKYLAIWFEVYLYNMHHPVSFFMM